jgi:hypothetical protein
VASSTRSPILAVAVLALVLLSACAKSDARLEKLSTGITKDSVLATMGAPQRVDPYLAGGHYIEAMYFPMPDATDSADLTDRKMSPVILSDGKVLAWGWKQWDSIAPTKKIKVAAP